MISMRETTKWDQEYTVLNHIYIFDKKPSGSAKCIAYVPHGSDTVFKFNNPVTIETRGRTFELVK
jgi:hypothetical protein